MKRQGMALTVAVLALAGGRLLAQVPAGERIPITDPDRLEAMGFLKDAKNVYVWSKADLGGSGTKDFASSASVETPETWGTQPGFTSISPIQLEDVWDDRIYLTRYLDFAQCEESDSNFDRWALAQIEVPEGARLGQFLFWAYDSHPDNDLLFEVYETCQANGAVPPTVTLIAQTFTILAIGQYFGFTSLNDLTVNNKTCTYSFRVQFASPGQDCVAYSLQFQKARVSWYRQVSPAPGTATFNDVPTDHPFFQFVEALVKSGITGGCSAAPPLYCPDAPLTRGQMAVFLAKGLGLEWP